MRKGIIFSQLGFAYSRFHYHGHFPCFLNNIRKIQYVYECKMIQSYHIYNMDKHYMLKKNSDML